MKLTTRGLLAAAIAMLFVSQPTQAQDSSIYIQCPNDTVLHPDSDLNPDTREDGIKCVHLAAGDGMVTMASTDDKPLYVFGFSTVPLPGEGGAPIDPSIYAGYVMDYGALSANAPAPTLAFDEDDEVFLQLTNVGMALRPDLSDPHTVHWHGFPNASAAFDGVPDASISINMGATLTYYYQPKDAGTYMYHCHVEATEHMQMGMLGNLYVRPRQNKLPDTTDLSGFTHHTGYTYAYNDGDGSTRYTKEVPIQIGSFDPDFHDASYSVQPLPFRSMKDRYFLLNGRGYPDTTDPNPMSTLNDLDNLEESQPVSSSIVANTSDIILLRISNLNVTIFNTIGTNGPPMKVIALDARLLRDGDGNNMYYETNSITLGGGQSADVLIDASQLASNSTFFLYSKNLDRLANDHENFGGAMTEIHIN